MAIEGSVLTNPSAAGSFTVTLPASNLQIVGIFHNLPYLQIDVSVGTKAILPNLGTGYRRVIPINFTPGTNTLNMYAPAAGFVVVYYGTPLPGSRPLTAYLGIVVTASPTAAGTGSVTPSFPKGTGRLVGYSNYVTASYVEIAFNIATGKSITFFDTNAEALDGVGGVTPLNMALADTFTVTYTAGAALKFYAFFYYQ